MHCSVALASLQFVRNWEFTLQVKGFRDRCPSDGIEKFCNQVFAIIADFFGAFTHPTRNTGLQ